jgi:hypothetical protein
MLLRSLSALAFLFSSMLCAAQDPSTIASSSYVTTSEPPEMLLILQVDGREIECDARQKQELEIESLNPEWIRSVQVLSGSEATLYYGTKGRDGVIIIQLKDSDLLPPQVQKIVEDGK